MTRDTKRGKKLEQQIAAHAIVCFLEINKAAKQPPVQPPSKEAGPIDQVTQKKNVIRGAAAAGVAAADAEM